MFLNIFGNLKVRKSLVLVFCIILLIELMNIYNNFGTIRNLRTKVHHHPQITSEIPKSPAHLCFLPYFKESPIPEKSRFNLKCHAKNEVKVKNGLLMISNPSSVSCFYNEIIRVDDFRTFINNQTIPFKNGDRIPSDYFRISCLDNKDLKQSFQMPLAGVVPKETIVTKRFSTKKIQKDLPGFDVNVAFLGFDSTSRLSFIRNLPESYDYFTNKMGAVVLQKHNIIGDGTTVNLLGILTGLKERELPEARKNKKNSKPVDQFPWIFKNFKRAGYVTLHAEDNQDYGTFQYRLKGFTQPPVDHYYRPYFLQYPYTKGCLGSTPQHQVMFNIMKEYYSAYQKPHMKKFSFIFHSESSHDNNSHLHPVDKDLVKMLKEFRPSGLFDNTILFLIGDHGARYSLKRKSLQGKYEERLPFFGVYLPNSLKKKKPHLIKLLRNNAKYLTSHLDIHATLLHILGEKRSKKRLRSQSLLDEMSLNRSCKDLEIEVHWCACTRWQSFPVNHRLGKDAVKFAINFINSLVKPVANMCARLKLDRIVSVEYYQTNKAILTFKNSWDHDGYYADLSDKMTAAQETFRVTFSVTPSDGQFELTANYNLSNRTFSIEESQISRINRFAPWIKCLKNQYPHLRKYCICLDSLKNKETG